MGWVGDGAFSPIMSVSVGTGTSLDVIDRLAGDTVQQEQQAGLAHHGNGRDGAPILFHLHQGGQWQVVIPQVVMQCLEVPEIISRGAAFTATRELENSDSPLRSLPDWSKAGAPNGK